MFRFRSLLTAAFALSLALASSAFATDFLRLNVGHVQQVVVQRQVQFVQQPVVLQQVQYAPVQQVQFVQRQQFVAPLVVQNRQFIRQPFVQPVVIRQQQFVRRPQAAVQLRFNFGR